MIFQPSKNANLPQVNIVVLGSSRVGKSTFIQRALDLREDASTDYPSKKMSLDGVIYIVRLFEILVDDITINDSRRITWPKLIEIPKQPSVDGVLMLYDVTDEESINEIPDILCKSGSLLCVKWCREQHCHLLLRSDASRSAASHVHY